MFVTLHTSVFLLLLAIYPFVYAFAFVQGEFAEQEWNENKKNYTVASLGVITATILGGSITSLIIYLI